MSVHPMPGQSLSVHLESGPRVVLPQRGQLVVCLVELGHRTATMVGLWNGRAWSFGAFDQHVTGVLAWASMPDPATL